MADVLLAKSRRHAEIDLVQHTLHVLNASAALFGEGDARTRLGRCWLRFFKLGEDAWAAFYTNLAAACALHDWGKANDGFQDEVHGRQRRAQALRHEHLSAMLIAQDVVWQWLGANSAIDRPLVLSAVMTHHLKADFPEPGKEVGFGAAINGNSKKPVRLLHRCAEFERMRDVASDALYLGSFDLAGIPETWMFDGLPVSIRDMRNRIKNEVLGPFSDDIEQNMSRKRMLLAVRAALIAADAAGSGLVRVGETVPEWIAKQLHEQRLWNGERVRTEIIEPRKKDLDRQFRARKKSPFAWNDFQLACDNLPSRALLLAPCGSGKTLAAWRWTAAQAEKRPVGHVLFLYPTRATAKEGFKDYVSWAPEADAALMHGTAEFDLRDMFDNENDARFGLSFEADRRLFALGFWRKRAFSATVDQFLAFLNYGYGAVCMLPVLADSILVVDEVHSFDHKMFSALKVFLNNFDLPVLCMTATLPRNRREQLEHECGLKVFEEKCGGTPRYRLTRVSSPEAAERRVREALDDKRRVLWVVNTVARCHEVVGRFVVNFEPAAKKIDLQMADGTPVYCYHSRFRLSDRVKRHDNVVNNLKDTGPAALAVTTQVCEMSLDLDVDLLISEECPVTSLIQRMGRCNRQRDARPLCRSGTVVVYKPADQNPYSRDDLTGLDEFLALVDGRTLSQTDLEDALGRVKSPPWGGDKLAPFIAGGPFAVAGEEDFRAGEEHNRQCLLPEEVGDYIFADSMDKPGFILPVPMRLAHCRNDEEQPEHKKLPRYLGVAQAGHYHAAIGFYDRTLDQWGNR